MSRTDAAASAVALVAVLAFASPASAEPEAPQPSTQDQPPAAAHGIAAPGAPGGPPANPPPPGPPAIDRDGVFAVGSQIQPGVYTSGGPLPGGACYWRRIGPGDTTLDNALTKQPQTVRIDPGDAAFKTSGCQPWQLAPGAVPPNQNPPWLAQWQLRHSLDILNGLAGQSGNGQLPPY